MMRMSMSLAFVSLVACECGAPIADHPDGGAADAGLDAGLDAGSDAGTAVRLDGGCDAEPVPGASWETGSCPDAGCPSGTFCLHGQGENSNVYGCAPVPVTCQSAPSCRCLGCVCALGCYDTATGPVCENGTISQRAFKDEIIYLTEHEREELARQALQIPLARYRYRNELPGGRRRLGFLIDDQPNPSPAVMEDRLHVDEYGYTSLLLVTIQQQARELAALRKRIENLERAK